MKKLAISIAFLLIPAAASAQGYFEGNIGIGFISSTDAQVSGPTNNDSATLRLEYGNAFIFGVETGVAGLGNANNLRLGVSWDYANANLDSVTAKASQFGAGGSFNCSTLELEINPLTTIKCSNLISRVNVFAANAYLDLGVGNAMALQPYLGVGAGLATFNNADSSFAMSGTVGARYPLGGSAYVGGRYRYQWISGPRSNKSIKYDQISIHGISFLLGWTF